MEPPLCHHRQFTILAALIMLALLFLAPVSAFSSINPSQQYLSVGRRLLGGPGSSPPSCRSKCGRCGPCQPVHVPIHPGFSMKMEYYPEAWRCKCGDKLFMP